MFKPFLILCFCCFGIHFGAFAQNDTATTPSYEEQIEQMTKQFQELFGQSGDLKIIIDTLHFDELGDAFGPMQSDDFGKDFQQLFEQIEQQMQQFQGEDFGKLFEGFEQFTIPAPDDLEEMPADEDEKVEKKKKKRKTYKI